MIQSIHQNRRKKESRRGWVNENSMKVRQEERAGLQDVQGDLLNGFLSMDFFIFKVVELN